MKDIAIAVWDWVPYKREVVITMMCILLSVCFAVYMALVPEVYRGQTVWQTYHQHSKRLADFNYHTDQAQNKLIVAVVDLSSVEMDIKLQEMALSAHKRGRVHFLDDMGNFKSDNHRQYYLEDGEEINRKMEELRLKFNKNQKSYSGRLMIAQRAR